MIMLCITYQMERMIGKPSDNDRSFSSAENCVSVSIPDEVAQELLKGNPSKSVQMFLDILAELQGFQKAYFCKAEIA